MFQFQFLPYIKCWFMIGNTQNKKLRGEQLKYGLKIFFGSRKRKRPKILFESVRSWESSIKLVREEWQKVISRARILSTPGGSIVAMVWSNVAPDRSLTHMASSRVLDRGDAEHVSTASNCSRLFCRESLQHIFHNTEIDLFTGCGSCLW